MKRNIVTAILMTVVTTILCGFIYPMVVTALAQVIFHDKANFAALTPSGFPVGGIVIVGISQNYFL